MSSRITRSRRHRLPSTRLHEQPTGTKLAHSLQRRARSKHAIRGLHTPKSVKGHLRIREKKERLHEDVVMQIEKKLTKLRDQAKLVNPDVHGLYIYGTYYGRGLIEIFENQLKKIVPSILEERTAYKNLVPLSVLMSEEKDWWHIDEPERVSELYSLVSKAWNVIYPELLANNLLEKVGFFFFEKEILLLSQDAPQFDEVADIYWPWTVIIPDNSRSRVGHGHEKYRAVRTFIPRHVRDKESHPDETLDDKLDLLHTSWDLYVDEFEYLITEADENEFSVDTGRYWKTMSNIIRTDQKKTKTRKLTREKEPERDFLGLSPASPRGFTF